LELKIKHRIKKRSKLKAQEKQKIEKKKGKPNVAKIMLVWPNMDVRHVLASHLDLGAAMCSFFAAMCSYDELTVTCF
jgi:hypothetical protein